MTNEQRKALTDLQEKIIRNRLSKTDTSWVETEEEMNDLKRSILSKETKISESNNYVLVTDYHSGMKYVIFSNGFIDEKKIDYSSIEKTDKIHTISGIMILGWLVLMFALMGILALMGLDFVWAIYGCIIFGIINLFVFGFTW